MPKAKAAPPAGLSADTKVYKSGISMYRLLLNGEVILESSTAQTRDYVLARMQEREAGKVASLSPIEIR